MSSNIVGSELPFWFTLYAINKSVGEYESDGNKSCGRERKKKQNVN